MLYFIQACESKEHFDRKDFLEVFEKIGYDRLTGIDKLQGRNGGRLINIRNKMSYLVSYNTNDNIWLDETITRDELRYETDISKKYIQNPDKCPFCSSLAITGEGGDFENITCHRDVTCGDCKAEWTENFQLTSISYDS